MQLYLASRSPRRQEILRGLGLRFRWVPSAYEEELPAEHPDPPALAREYARQKMDRAALAGALPGLAVAADTLVYLGERVFGKPVDAADAERMIAALSGQVHRVVTGLCLRSVPEGVERWVAAVTEVAFDELSPEDVHRYLEWGDWHDKAGAYAIQGQASCFIREIRGCYFNVVGFPVNLFFRTVAEMGTSLDVFRVRGVRST